MTPHCTRLVDSCNVDVIEKLAHACYFQIAREIMLLLVNNIKEMFEARIHAIQQPYLYRNRSPSLFPLKTLNLRL